MKRPNPNQFTDDEEYEEAVAYWRQQPPHHDNTRLLYQNARQPNVDRAKTSARVRAISDIQGFSLVEVNKTVAHPNEGGQPADKGVMTFFDPKKNRMVSLPMVHVSKGSLDSVLHYIQGAPPKVHSEVEIAIDPEWRMLIERYHSAGHLILGAIRSYCPGHTIMGYGHDPERAFIDVENRGYNFPESLTHAIQEKTQAMVAINPRTEIIRQKMPFQTSKEKIRMVTIGGSTEPCEGTHVENTAAIGPINFLTTKEFTYKPGDVQRYSIADIGESVVRIEYRLS